MVRKDCFPAFDQTRRDRLCADVHQAPLIQLVIGKINVAPLDRIQNVLRPRNEKPDNRALFLGNGTENPLRVDSFQQNRFPSHKKTAEPVHFRAGMI